MPTLPALRIRTALLPLLAALFLAFSPVAPAQNLATYPGRLQWLLGQITNTNLPAAPVLPSGPNWPYPPLVWNTNGTWNDTLFGPAQMTAWINGSDPKNTNAASTDLPLYQGWSSPLDMHSYSKAGFWAAQGRFEKARQVAATNSALATGYLLAGQKRVDYGLTYLNWIEDEANKDQCFAYHAAMDTFLRWKGVTINGTPVWSTAQESNLLVKLSVSFCFRNTNSSGYLGGTTSNHKLMYATARYLAGKAWPTNTFRGENNTPKGGVPCTSVETGPYLISSSPVDTTGRDYLLAKLNDWAENGIPEFDSETYMTEYFSCLRSLADLAPANTDGIRERAQILFEMLLAHSAAGNLDSLTCASSTRSYDFFPRMTSGNDVGWLFFGGPPRAVTRLYQFCTSGTNQLYVNDPPITGIRAGIVQAATNRTLPFLHRGVSGRYSGPFYYQTIFQAGGYAVFSSANPTNNIGAGQAMSGGVYFDSTNLTAQVGVLVKHPAIPYDDASEFVRTPAHTWTTEVRLGASSYEKVLQARGTLLQVYRFPTNYNYNGVTSPTFADLIGKIAPNYTAHIRRLETNGPFNGSLCRLYLHYGNVMICLRSTAPFAWTNDPPSGWGYTGPHPYFQTEIRIKPPMLTDTNRTRYAAVAIETADPADYLAQGFTTASNQLAAFLTNTWNQPFTNELANLALANPTVTYVTASGDSLTQDYQATNYINGVPVDYDGWPRQENPWIAQARVPIGAGGSLLFTSFADPATDREFGYDFTTWTRSTNANVQNLWIEAEEAATQTNFAPFQLRADGNAAGGAYIERLPDTGGNPSNSTTAVAFYPFDVSGPGNTTLYFWLRARAYPLQLTNVGGNNSCWADIVTAAGASVATCAVQWGLPAPIANPVPPTDPSVNWTWYPVYGTGASPNSRTLAPGSYRLKITNREDGTQFDRILITGQTPAQYDPRNDPARN